MTVPDLLTKVRFMLNQPGVDARAVSEATGIGYDTVRRIRSGATPDPGWSAVYGLAQHLLKSKRRPKRKAAQN